MRIPSFSTIKTTVVNYVSANKWNIAAKTAGALTAGYVLYNANYAGQKDSQINVKRKQGERITKYYMNSRRLEDRNKITSKLKDTIFRSNADWNLPDKINAVTGYIGGAFNQLAVDVIPAALATGALLSKKFAKPFTIGLGVWAAKYLICDVLDPGRPNYLKSDEV